MTLATNRPSTPTRPLPLAPGTLEFFRLGELAAELEAREEYRRAGVAGATIARDDEATAVLVALRAGAVMREHRAPASAVVVLLSGRARFTAGEGAGATELAPGSLAVFAADVPHAVEALEDARYLVVIGGRRRPVEARRPAPSLRAVDTVTELLEVDHRRLDEMLIEAKRCAGGGDAARAAAGFREFRHGLERHIVAEEEVLFPALDRLTGGRAAGPIGVMRAEHAELRRRLAELSAALERGAADAGRRIGELNALLFAHNGKEERILYPMADQVAEADGSLPALLAGLRETLARSGN
jgi:quercetin dioxygenase-like cupin family protein